MLLLISLLVIFQSHSDPQAYKHPVFHQEVYQQKTGTIYIAKLPSSEAFESEGKGSSTVEGYSDNEADREVRRNRNHTFGLELVGVKKINVTQKNSNSIKGLNISKRYKFKIYAGNSVIESFYFSFKERGSNRLKLSYDPFYSSWRLDPM